MLFYYALKNHLQIIYILITIIVVFYMNLYTNYVCYLSKI
jgi:hypothetical protein